MLYNGYGEHNIQGIGDKHIPLIHNVMNTDVVVGVSDRSTDALDVLFNTEAGRGYLTRRRRIDPALVAALDGLGLSGIANVLAAIKTAKHLDLTPIGCDRHGRDRQRRDVRQRARALPGDALCRGVSTRSPPAKSSRAICSRRPTDHLIELTHVDRRRIFNLGYYTWVEQQGVSLEAFDRRKDQAFWQELQASVGAWDRLIEDFNRETGVKPAGVNEAAPQRAHGREEELTEPYLELRRKTMARDRSLREKVMTLEEAAGLVEDGDAVGIGGSTLSRTPMAMIWALIRAGRKNLSCARSITSSEGELLFASGACDHILTSWFSQGIVWGVSKVMRHYTESGKARFEEWSHMAVGLRFRAGAMGVPFLPMRSMLGSDIIRRLPDVHEMACPFTGEKLVLVPALNPDVALIHVQRCDPYGNAQMDGLSFMDLDLAMAANRVILTTERIVSNDQIRRAPDQTKIPFFAVEAVVEVPFGCAPHECYGAYEPFFEHLDQYAALIRKDPESGMREYLARHVYEPKSWTDYLDLLGLEELLAAARRGRSIDDD